MTSRKDEKSARFHALGFVVHQLSLYSIISMQVVDLLAFKAVKCYRTCCELQKAKKKMSESQNRDGRLEYGLIRFKQTFER